MKLFHLAQQRLGPGSVILPGNYGRMLRRYGWAHTAAFRETLLETVRASSYPERPSRLDCVFAFLREEDARHFQKSESGFRDHALHLVRTVRPTGDRPMCVHVTDHRWLLPAFLGSVLPSIDWAHRYWCGLPHIAQALTDAWQRQNAGSAVAPVEVEVPVRGDERCEVLIGGPVVVEECLDDL